MRLDKWIDNNMDQLYDNFKGIKRNENSFQGSEDSFKTDNEAEDEFYLEQAKAKDS